MRDIDPLVWFGTRELKVIPKHFIRATTPATSESIMWVITKLTGRYSVGSYETIAMVLGANLNQYIFFEDPAEAMIYELRWAG
jgi:folate-dependent tRNA-U54 methylase TrmFO/GidA